MVNSIIMPLNFAFYGHIVKSYSMPAYLCHWAGVYRWTTFPTTGGRTPASCLAAFRSVMSLVGCLLMFLRDETVYTHLQVHGWDTVPRLLFLRHTGSLWSPKGFQNSSHIWGYCQQVIWISVIMQFSTWALESVPGFKS